MLNMQAQHAMLLVLVLVMVVAAFARLLTAEQLFVVAGLVCAGCGIRVLWEVIDEVVD